MKPRFFVNRGRKDRTGRASHSRGYVYGVHAIAARLKIDPPQVARLHVVPDPSPRLASLVQEASRRRVPIDPMPAVALRELCRTDHHQGVVAAVPPFPYCDLERALARRPERVLVLDRLQDPHNFGALLRTAEATGFRLVILPKDGAVAVTAAVEKAAAGAAIRLMVARVVNLARTLEHLKGMDYWVVGLDIGTRTELYDFEPHRRVALVVGAEQGLRNLVQRNCDQLLSIPMEGDAESLNASVAGAVAMYELRRRVRALS